MSTRRLLFIAALLLVSASGTFAQVVTPPPTPTPTPAPTTMTVRLSWSEATTGPTFNVYRWDKTQTAGFSKINSVPITLLTYDDPTAQIGVTYSYKVTAVNSAGESAQSTEAVISVSAPVVIPAVPTNLKVTVVVTN